MKEMPSKLYITDCNALRQAVERAKDLLQPDRSHTILTVPQLIDEAAETINLLRGALGHADAQQKRAEHKLERMRRRYRNERFDEKTKQYQKNRQKHRKRAQKKKNR